MSKLIKRLKANELLKLVKPGYHHDGAGLYLQVRKGSGTRSWIFRYVFNGQPREMGLGAYPLFSLAQARDRHTAARQALADGVDPINARRALKAEQTPAPAPMSFDDAAVKCIQARSSQWSNDKHAAQWTSTLKRYAAPVFGHMPVAKVGLKEVADALRPIWLDKPETATRVRERIAVVLDWAVAAEVRTGANPARRRDQLDTLLGALSKEQKLERTKQHRALPVSELPAFMKALKTHDGNGARALEFAILTAARSGEVRGARWSEIDLESAVWSIPASRMKARVAHRVPLSEAAMAILYARARAEDDDLIFPAPRGGEMSDMTLSAVTRRMGVDAVPHGFRATFKTWTADETTYPPHIAEMALAHAIESKVEATYQRTDLLAKRRAMMADWAQRCISERPGADVVPIRATR